MAAHKKYDYVQICSERGLTYLREENPYIFVKCELGYEHKITRTNLAKGCTVGFKSVCHDKTQYFLDVLKSKHPDAFEFTDFSKFTYDKSLSESLVTCKTHGDYKTKANWLLIRGHHCLDCANEEKKYHQNIGLSGFIEKCSKIYNGKYDYSKTVYKTCRDKVTVTCPIHGDFEIVAYYHSSGGNGCQKCGLELGGFSKKDYKKLCENGSNVYLLNFKSEYENFFKIGISKNVRNRINDYLQSTLYEVSILNVEFFPDAGNAWDLEKLLLKEFKNFKYEPRQYFQGQTECVKGVSESEIIKLMKCCV